MSAQPSTPRRGRAARRRRSRSAACRWPLAHGSTCGLAGWACVKRLRAGRVLRLTIVGQNHQDVRARLRRHSRRCKCCCGHHGRQHHAAGPGAGHPLTGRGALPRRPLAAIVATWPSASQSRYARDTRTTAPPWAASTVVLQQAATCQDHRTTRYSYHAGAPCAAILPRSILTFFAAGAGRVAQLQGAVEIP